MFKKLFVLFAAFFLFGCVSFGGQGFDPVNVAKASGQVQNFLEEHPNAKIVAVLLDESQARERLTAYPDCASVKPQAMYVATFDDSPTKAIVFVSEKEQKVLCVVVSGTPSSTTPTAPLQEPTEPASPPTSQQAPAAGVELSEYKDERFGFKIMKPPSWKADLVDKNYLLVSENDNTDVIIWPIQLQGEFKKASGVGIGNYLIGLVKKKFPDFSVLSIHIAPDNSSMQVVATYALDGVKTKGVLNAFADAKGNGLLSGYEAPETEFDAKEPLLRRILVSYSPPTQRPVATTAQPAAKALQMEKAGDGDVSMLVPKGWKFYSGGSCETKWVQAGDPKNKARRVFAYTQLGPVYFDAAAKQRDAEYCAGIQQWYGGSAPCMITWVDAPLATSATEEAFLNVMQGIFEMAAVKKAAPNLEPFAMQVTGKEQTTQQTLYSLSFDFNGVPAIGKATIAGVLPNQVAGIMHGVLIVGVAADSESLGQLYPSLVKSVESITLSEQYASACKSAQAERGERFKQISKTLSETSDLIVKGYQGRQKGPDIISEKRSDAILGVERVYNPDADEVYSVPNGFYDSYNTNREYFQKSNLQLLSPDQYAKYAPLDGALHVN